MFEAKSIDELYEEVKYYDIVLCNDAPLALALNNRLERPRVGVFAITPRQLAGDLAIDILGEPLLSDIEVVRKISKDTGYPLRFVHGEVDNIKTIRRYAKDVERYLRNKKSIKIYHHFIRLNTLEKAMEEFDGTTDPFFTGKKVAVIGAELFDDLDKHFHNTGVFDDIDMVKDYSSNAFKIPTFRLLSNDYEIAENAVNLIKDRDPKDVAIVLDAGGKIADMVRSELYREKIPFINDLSIRDIDTIRDFIEFLNKSHNFNIIKVHQIRELLQKYGGKLRPKCDDYLIERYDEIVANNEAAVLLDVMKNIGEKTYGWVCENVLKDQGSQVKILLGQLELYDVKINPADTADIIYSVNNFELKHNIQIPNNEKEGVLIVDCKNSVYVDRPLILFLGLGSDWEKDLDDLNLIDSRFKDGVVENNVTKFQILLQQGSSRVYICNAMRKGKESKPCQYFQEADHPDKIYKTFEDVSDCVYGPWYRFEKEEPGKFGSVEINEQRKEFEFSASKFNSYINCPKRFMFGEIVDSVDNGESMIGNYLHSYAEFKICYPEEVEKRGAQFFIDYISDKCLPLFSPEIRRLKESKIRAALLELDRFIESHDFHDGIAISEMPIKYPNPFFEMIGKKDTCSDRNEVTMSCLERHMHGKLDLIKDGHIYDYKTGNPKDAKKVLSCFDGNKGHYADYQAMFYISLMEDNGVDYPSFTYFYTSANESRIILGQEIDADASVVHIELTRDIDMMHDFVPSYGDMRFPKYDGIKSRWDDFIDIIRKRGFENSMNDKLGTANYVQSQLNLPVPDGKKGKDVIDSIVRSMEITEKVLNKGIYIYGGHGNIIHVSKRALENFRKLMKDSYDTILEQYKGRFLKNPDTDCDGCYFLDMCTRSQEADSDE